MRNNQRGQTLIEVLTAIFIIMVGMVGVLALTTSNLRNQRIGLGRLLATQLAKEGIELTRAIRDTNWLSHQPWDAGLLSGASECARIAPDGNSFDFISCGNLTDPGYRLKRDTQGLYNSTTGTNTSFYRRITLNPVCVDLGVESVGPSDSCNSSTKVGVQVTSEVGWDYNGIPRSIVLVEKLYNWR